MKPGKRRALYPKRKRHRLMKKAEQLKASARDRVEHPFRVIKQQFGYEKVRYCGLKTNTKRLVCFPVKGTVQK
jgi:transposase, IS5 family